VFRLSGRTEQGETGRDLVEGDETGKNSLVRPAGAIPATPLR
jgi:hypothetical protein